MKASMFPKHQLVWLTSAFMLASSTVAPASAFRLPTGTVQAEKRLEPKEPTEEDVNEPVYDLTESAAVVSMIKLLAHYLPQQVYFLNSEPSPNYPSINVISLLIKLAASAKMPDKAVAAKKDKSGLNLAPPVINTDESGGSINQPKVKTKPDKKSGKLSIGQKSPSLNELDPESTVRQEEVRKTRSITSESLYDAKNLDAKKPEETAEHNKIKTANLYSDFLAPTARLNPPKENMQFLFWTCPQQSTTSVQAKDASTEAKFEGSFVVSQQGTRFKSVHGRQFTLEEGKLLACNRQAELSFQTPMATITLPPGTTALITLTKTPASLSIQSIESNGGKAVTVAIKEGKKLYLASGQQVDINADGLPTTKQFSIAQLTQKERLIDSQASYLNQQQAQALSELQKRISASTTAAGAGTTREEK